MTKMASALLAVVLSTAAFSVTAFASGGEESTESVAEQETAGDVPDPVSYTHLGGGIFSAGEPSGRPGHQNLAYQHAVCEPYGLSLIHI